MPEDITVLLEKSFKDSTDIICVDIYQFKSPYYTRLSKDV